MPRWGCLAALGEPGWARKEAEKVPCDEKVAPMKAAVVKESAPGERRVALVPEAIPKLRDAGLEVLVETGAGDGAWFPASAYADAGATIVSQDELLSLIHISEPTRH